MELRIPPEEKAVIARAAALEHLNVAGFILRTVLPKARELVEKAEYLKLSVPNDSCPRGLGAP
ncbi:DUF1778 domain-containing protein [Rhizobium sp. 2YAF20]|uniref:type II toxin-antitoxin system TacA family antitoxin n=1 Tax=Rhizobium sp. 2YAF20 TaxID=3233027 RepID=UPI003F9C3126